MQSQEQGCVAEERRECCIDLAASLADRQGLTLRLLDDLDGAGQEPVEKLSAPEPPTRGSIERLQVLLSRCLVQAEDIQVRLSIVSEAIQR